MTPEERQLLSGLFDRLKSANPGQIDQEALALIQENVRNNPNAAYVMAQSVLVQEEMLKTASARIEDMDAQIADLQDRVQQSDTANSGFLGGFGKSLFGGKDAAPAAPQPAAQPRSALGSAVPRRMGGGMGGSVGGSMAAGAGTGAAMGAARGPGSGIQVPSAGGMGNSMGAAPVGAPGPWAHQREAAQQQQPGGGGSFLKGALGAAVGVAGGMLLANQLSSMFGGNKAQAADGSTSPTSAASNDGWGDNGAGSFTPDSASSNASSDNWGDDTGGNWDDNSSGGWDDNAGGDDWGGDE